MRHWNRLGGAFAASESSTPFWDLDRPQPDVVRNRHGRGWRRYLVLLAHARHRHRRGHYRSRAPRGGRTNRRRMGAPGDREVSPGRGNEPGRDSDRAAATAGSPAPPGAQWSTCGVPKNSVHTAGSSRFAGKPSADAQRAWWSSRATSRSWDAAAVHVIGTAGRTSLVGSHHCVATSRAAKLTSDGRQRGHERRWIRIVDELT
jgi:hypothetical protein